MESGQDRARANEVHTTTSGRKTVEQRPTRNQDARHLLGRSAPPPRVPGGWTVRRRRLRDPAAGRDRPPGLQRAGLGAADAGRLRLPGTSRRARPLVGLRPDPRGTEAHAQPGAGGECVAGAQARPARCDDGLAGTGRVLVQPKCDERFRCGWPAGTHPARGRPFRKPRTRCPDLRDRRPPPGPLRRGRRPLRPPAPRRDHHPAERTDQSSRRVAHIGRTLPHHGQAAPRDRGRVERAGGRHGLGCHDRRERQRANLDSAAPRTVGHAPGVTHL